MLKFSIDIDKGLMPMLNFTNGNAKINDIYH